jgi:UDP-N-acetylglucosamine 1-carboxyvinyltransferase
VAKAPDDLVRRITRLLRVARKEKGITQEVLAERLDVSVQNLRRIESGRQNVTLRTVARIAKAIGVAIEVTTVDIGPGEVAPTPRKLAGRARRAAP